MVHRPSIPSFATWLRMACFALALLLVWIPLAAARADQPISNPELSLMLRAGYTSDEVLREVSTRHLLDALDAATERTLRLDGADQHLIDALNSGEYLLSRSDAAGARQLQEVRDQQLLADREAGHDRLLASLHQQAQRALSRHMANLFRGKLVVWKDGGFQPYDSNLLTNKTLFALYYSASWCGPCRQFTPWLIEFYRQFAPAHPEFELVFISEDRSAAEMESYMRADGMPWPALPFEKKAQEAELNHYAGPGIPCLVLVDGNGGVLSDSFKGKTYTGPRHVIEDLCRLTGTRIAGAGEK